MPELKQPFLKRPLDLSLAVLGLILSSPLWLAFSLAIYLEDRGAVFFLQERCGRQGKVFKAIKFRTMRSPTRKENCHAIVDIEHDPRVTKVGKLLRGTAMDELPQLINILKGDMSFVGPRALPFKIEDKEKPRYSTIADVPGYHLRSHVRPGLTGISQVYAPRGVSQRNKFRYDSLYVRNMGFALDMRLLLLSIWRSLRGGWGRGRRKL